MPRVVFFFHTHNVFQYELLLFFMRAFYECKSLQMSPVCVEPAKNALQGDFFFLCRFPDFFVLHVHMDTYTRGKSRAPSRLYAARGPGSEDRFGGEEVEMVGGTAKKKWLARA